MFKNQWSVTHVSCSLLLVIGLSFEACFQAAQFCSYTTQDSTPSWIISSDSHSECSLTNPVFICFYFKALGLFPTP